MSFKYGISAVAIMKYENPFVVEWIEYHNMIGISHFYIYDNDENSGLLELLKFFIDQKIVTLIHFPGDVLMFDAYNNAIENYKDESKYIAYIDTDEFIVNKNFIPGDTSGKSESLFITVDKIFDTMMTMYADE